MQEFLNENLKPYNALTREEKHILLDAMIDECLQYYSRLTDTWCDKYETTLGGDYIYRTKPKEYKKLNVPWEYVDDYWKYAVMDGDGSILVYATKPEWLSEHNMWSCNHQYRSVDPLKLDTTGIVAEHSLTQRDLNSI